MFVLAESQKWNKIDNRPDLGTALLKAILNENDLKNKIVSGQTRYSKDFFINEFDEIITLINKLPSKNAFFGSKYLIEKAKEESIFKKELKEDYSLFKTKNEEKFFDLNSQIRLNKNLDSIYSLYLYWFNKEEITIVNNLFNEIKKNKPDVVGFSLSFPEPITEKVREKIKLELDVPIILGGSLSFHIANSDLRSFFFTKHF